MAAILTGRLPVDDGGWPRPLATRRVGSGYRRPVQSEVDATDTLWIDTETLLPRRCGFTYSMPRFADAAFDLTFDE
jgi:hypothetical protein